MSRDTFDIHFRLLGFFSGFSVKKKKEIIRITQENYATIIFFFASGIILIFISVILFHEFIFGSQYTTIWIPIVGFFVSFFSFYLGLKTKNEKKDFLEINLVNKTISDFEKEKSINDIQFIFQSGILYGDILDIALGEMVELKSEREMKIFTEYWGIYFTPPKYAFTIRAYGLSFKSNGIRRNVLGRG